MKKNTKLLSPKDQFATDDFAEVLSPLVEPADENSAASIDQMLGELGFVSERPSTVIKLQVLLSSFLMQSARLLSRLERKGEAMVLGIPHDEVYWRKRSKVGYKVAKRLCDALISVGWITHYAEAKINLFDGDSNCTGYLVSDNVPQLSDGLKFQSTDLVYASSSSATKKKLEVDHIDDRVRSLWAKWKTTPLTQGTQKMFIAPRRFNDLNQTRGGRFYGAWTNMRKVERLECTIQGKPVGEVDVSGMHLTLLCSITGEIPFKTRFKDAYECGYENRDHVKPIINETIGAGTPRHYTRGGLTKKAGLSQEQFTYIRKNFIAPKFKCLKHLEKGKLDGLSLMYHESEIMMRVVERSKLPIFILHDCLICQQGEELEVGKMMQDVYADYCTEHGWTPVAPAFSIERRGEEKRLISGRRHP